MGLDSPERVGRSVIFKVGFTIGRLGNILDFFVVVVVTVLVGLFIIVVLMILLVFDREVKLDEELSIPFAFKNVDFGLLTRSEDIPALDEFLNLFDVGLISDDLVNLINVVFVEERRIEPDLLFGRVLQFDQVLLLVWK